MEYPSGPERRNPDQRRFGHGEDQAPAGASFGESSLQLYDDGQHADGQAGDGVYGNSFRRLTVPGEYRLTVQADGTASTLVNFARSFESQIVIANGIDGDGDGLPNAWENAKARIRRWSITMWISMATTSATSMNTTGHQADRQGHGRRRFCRRDRT